MAGKPSDYDEEWLDDEASPRLQRRSKAKQKKYSAKRIKPSEANATVIEVHPKACYVLIDGEQEARLCAYRRAGVFRRPEEGARERTPVAVGDRVKARKEKGQTGTVLGVASRRNQLVRPAPGREGGRSGLGGVVHVVAANVDQLVIVASVRRPEFSPGLVDRYLVASKIAGIEPLLCVNKSDLQTENVEEAPWDLYRELGVKVLVTSAKFRQGVEELRGCLNHRSTVFCGHSGVGKTSLLREILGRDIGKVGDVQAVTQKGRHTTTGAVFYQGESESSLIDTPGVRSFGLVGVEPINLAAYFPEFSQLSCAAEGCSHMDEPDCRARDLPRYLSFRRILESLLEAEAS